MGVEIGDLLKKPAVGEVVAVQPGDEGVVVVIHLGPGVGVVVHADHYIRDDLGAGIQHGDAKDAEH